jgi:uncharacterized phage infection (PIP) family protein YhgE
MTIATEMKELTRDIASSHADRMRRISEIKEEANQTRGEAKSLIKSFGASRKETGRQLRRELVQDKAHRKSEAMTIIREAQNILIGFETSRKESSAKLRKDLSRGTAERRSEVRETLEDAQKLVKDYRTSRQKLSSKLREELNESRTKAKSDVEELLGNVQSLMEDFQTSRKEVGSKLRSDLAQNRADRESDVQEMRDSFRRARTDLRADLKEAGAAWQELASTVQTRRARAEVPSEVVVVEEETAETPVAEEESPDLETKLLTAVNEHPEGITLSEVADSFGVALIVLGRASRSLLEKGEIRKEEKIYFPVTSE